MLGEAFVCTLMSYRFEDHIHSVENTPPDVTSSDFLRQTLQRFDALDVILAGRSAGEVMDRNTLALCASETKDIRRYCSGTNHWLALYRQRIMLTETMMDRSLRHLVDVVCPDVVSAILSNTPVSGHEWLLSLQCPEDHNVRQVRSEYRYQFNGFHPFS